jgi:triosephosphate isomerase
MAPPATLLQAMAHEATHSVIGAQNCHQESGGAFTGEISAPMLADAGARFVIVGHSERRWQHNESDSLVRAKAEAVLAARMGVIVCVGESEEKRQAGLAEATVTAQLKASLPLVADAAAHLSVGYEPVWAIGTGRAHGSGCGRDASRHSRRAGRGLWRGGRGCVFSMAARSRRRMPRNCWRG